MLTSPDISKCLDTEVFEKVVTKDHEISGTICIDVVENVVDFVLVEIKSVAI